MFYVRFVVGSIKNKRQKNTPVSEQRRQRPHWANGFRSSGVEGRQTKQKKNVSAAHFLPVFSKRYAIAENGKNGRWKNGGFYGNPDVIIAIYPLHQ